jgi:hypothetical protein
MQKNVEVLQDFCDVCGKESTRWNECNTCRKNICFNCRKTDAVEYSHSIYASGSGDGRYCLACNARLIASGDPKVAAYREIAALRNEANGWQADFEKRRKDAEDKLQKIIKREDE